MDERLKQLMDYTKFHVGMYVTLVSALIAFISGDYVGDVDKGFHYWLLVTVCLLVIAGMAGGLVASSIPDHSSYDEFIGARLGPWDQEWIRARECVHLEHTTFWLAAVNAVSGLVVSTHKPPIGPWLWTFVPAVAGVLAVVLAVRGTAPVAVPNAAADEPSPVPGAQPPAARDGSGDAAGLRSHAHEGWSGADGGLTPAQPTAAPTPSATDGA